MSKGFYRFARLIRKYSIPVLVIKESQEGTWNDKGEFEAAAQPIEEYRQCVVIPYSTKTVNSSGGEIKRGDKQIYSLTPFEHGEKFIHKGSKFKINTDIDYTDYSDFYMYHAQAVSVFDQF